MTDNLSIEKFEGKLSGPNNIVIKKIRQHNRSPVDVDRWIGHNSMLPIPKGPDDQWNNKPIRHNIKN
ncbi:MAG: hypothetical protein Edafosvirus17_24 [Edafosvirus sp.]|uniref:Uncharacterized protein n=1 Tax=Edafosvirus sp. TaxID=2487765 RepID=A0A3G4ZUH3_9VIRU|nr:MAG: hypothetical protein Edafosvirus17_24 [Edafosvirus sp.]